MHMTALGLGLGSWAICALVKLTGPKLINAMPEFGEDAEALHRARRFSSKASGAVSFNTDGQNTVDKDDSYERASNDGGAINDGQDDEDDGAVAPYRDDDDDYR